MSKKYTVLGAVFTNAYEAKQAARNAGQTYIAEHDGDKQAKIIKLDDQAVSEFSNLASGERKASQQASPVEIK